MKSKDGITKTQANKFVKMGGSLSNLRLNSQGYWIADDSDDEGNPYLIDAETYRAAVMEGDIK